MLAISGLYIMELTLHDVGGPHPITRMAQRENTGLPEEENSSLKLRHQLLPGCPACWLALRILDLPARLMSGRRGRTASTAQRGLAKFRSSKSPASSACPYPDMSPSQFLGSHYFLTNVLTLTKGPLIRGWKIGLLCPSATRRIRL